MKTLNLNVGDFFKQTADNHGVFLQKNFNLSDGV
jgi:hypothetical protein